MQIRTSVVEASYDKIVDLSFRLVQIRTSVVVLGCYYDKDLVLD